MSLRTGRHYLAYFQRTKSQELTGGTLNKLTGVCVAIIYLPPLRLPHFLPWTLHRRVMIYCADFVVYPRGKHTQTNTTKKKRHGNATQRSNEVRRIAAVLASF